MPSQLRKLFVVICAFGEVDVRSLWEQFNSLIPRRLFLLDPLKPDGFGRKRHELGSPNLGGHLSHNPTLCYNLPERRKEMGCGLQG
ncbi:hypothetical protein AVEN_146986-1 [Araneus ventricosus]|uniref:Uncharacterized protein n=1 Tax=Araneus ventricosus TaxID=182803 RepID=A0A4Y2HRG9_ARAVE|nr:hypothetical protein AVEN_146986-1 [Araneus ventricosus]